MCFASMPIPTIKMFAVREDAPDDRLRLRDHALGGHDRGAADLLADRDLDPTRVGLDDPGRALNADLTRRSDAEPDYLWERRKRSSRNPCGTPHGRRTQQLFTCTSALTQKLLYRAGRVWYSPLWKGGPAHETEKELDGVGNTHPHAARTVVADASGTS